MPFSPRMARLNKAGLNRLTRRIAPRMRMLGVVQHRGRRSGRTFQTPVNVFPQPGGLVIALTYGTDTDWVRNVLGAGGCTVLTRGRAFDLVNPQIYHDGLRQGIRPLEARVLRLLGVADFLSLDLAGGVPATTGRTADEP